MNSLLSTDHDIAGTEAQLNGARSRHDIRASLAITKGFCQALEGALSSLAEAQGSAAVSPHDTDLAARIEELEKDCQFCLSRILRSVDQLDTNIETFVDTGRQHFDETTTVSSQ